MLLALFGVTFLTPGDAVFVLAAAVPLAALVVTERRSRRIRDLLGLKGSGRRAIVQAALALVLLPALVAIAAAQPVVVRQQSVKERGDAQAFIVFDTSDSMRASSGPLAPTRLARSKKIALRLQHALGDVPVGIATMTDRVLPDLMPTTDPALFDRTLAQSVGIDEPPPSQQYQHNRATNLQALVPVVNSHFFSEAAKRRLLVVFTDGEASRDLQLYALGMGRQMRPVFVHMWATGERIYRHGKPDPFYVADPSSADLLKRAADLSNGKVFDESQVGPLLSWAKHLVGHGSTKAHVNAYARIALAPWFALAGVFPLGFLFYRRNL
ncbi:MAG TPA: vWA domain-containing protein [Gaiellaceae bacterium]|nr:vWA domain-containing protein [Gaiellaceae bacterium]